VQVCKHLLLTSKSFLPHLDFGQAHAQPCMGVQASPREKHEGTAAAVSGANSWSTVCLHAAGSHPPAAAQAADAFRGTQEQGGQQQEHPKKPQILQISITSKGSRKT